jgi:hypothetical protein
VTVPETFPRLFCAACVVVGFAGVAGLGGVACCAPQRIPPKTKMLIRKTLG